ncbi:MAG: pseudouridine synthase [Colwellia sp.]|nr:pseudouridine synthase [Colwellia sp.]
MRLDKFICKSTELSRNEAKSLLKQGEVRVNGEVIKNPATQVHENNEITVDGQSLMARTSRYIMMNKPLDTICSNVDENHPSLLHLVEVDKAFDLHIAGRLDVDTTGLVLITDDGRWSHNIISPKKLCKKTYRVWLRNSLDEAIIEQFKLGVQLQGESSLTQPAQLIVAEGCDDKKEVLLTITEGKYHQVKRMFAAVFNRVVGLHREQIGDIVLPDDLALGQWRHLTEEEVNSVS